MPRRLRTSTPGMMLGPLGGPNSPPQSPTSSSPMLNHKQYAARHLPPYHNINRPVLLDDSGIQATGNGHQFSFTPSNRFAQLSPRTSSEDSDEEDESESESESDESEAPPTKPIPVHKDEDSDEEEEDSEEDSEDEEESDEDGDISMNIHPPAPAPMPAPMPASMPPAMSAPRSPPMHAPRMAVDSSSEEESDDEEEEDDDDDEEEDDSEEEEDSNSDSDSEVLPHAPELPQEPRPAAAPKANFTVEELSDFDPMDDDRIGAIAPSGFSSPASARSRSRAPTAAAPAGLPPGFTQNMRNLNCSASDSESDSDSSEDVDEDAAAHREFVLAQRELRMRKRRTHGSSIGKRTISERSDSDHEDWTPIDPDAVGSSARRLRRRVGDRRSFIHLQFQDPPPPRIDECDEPESEVEGAVYFCDGETLARELPYWSIETMEYESPSP